MPSWVLQSHCPGNHISNPPTCLKEGCRNIFKTFFRANGMVPRALHNASDQRGSSSTGVPCSGTVGCWGALPYKGGWARGGIHSGESWPTEGSHLADQPGPPSSSWPGFRGTDTLSNARQRLCLEPGRFQQQTLLARSFSDSLLERVLHATNHIYF